MLNTLRRAAWLFCVVCAVAAFVGIFALTLQTPEQTTALSQAAERHVTPITSTSPSTGTTGASLGGGSASPVGIRQTVRNLLKRAAAKLLSYANIRAWAHVPEFFVQGLLLFGVAALWPPRDERETPAKHLRARYRIPLQGRLAIALALCVACSLFDQIHKVFVPGREFDPRDLLFDATGYLLALAVVAFAAGVAKRIQVRMVTKNC